MLAALNASGGAAIPVLSYNTLTATIATLQSAYAQYNVPTPANAFIHAALKPYVNGTP